MILDENTTRLLVSEALKDQIVDIESNVIQNNDDVDGSIDSIMSEVYIDNFDQTLSICGQLIDFTRDFSDTQIELQLRVSLVDAHEIFDLIKKQNSSRCSKYRMEFFKKAYEALGPFDICLTRISNLNYKTNQCTIFIELVRSDK